MARLGDICNILNGYAFKSENYVDKGIRVIRIANVQKGYIEDNTPQFYPENTDEDISKYMLYSGDLLLSLTGNVGRVAILTEAFLPAALNQRVACLRIKRQDVDKSYLYHYLNSDSFEHKCIMSSKGVAQKNMSTEWLKECDVLLPPIEKQKHVAAALDTLANLIALRKQQLIKLDELVKARFVEMFGDPVQKPPKWDLIELSCCLLTIDNGKSFVCESKSRRESWPAVLKLSAVTYGTFRQEENKAVKEAKDFVADAEIRVNDLLFTRKNTPELVGMSAYVFDCEPNLMMPDLIFRLNTNTRCNKIFLWQLINHDLFRKEISALASGSAKSMSNISKERLAHLQIICPPLDLQQQFARFVEQTHTYRLTIQQSLDKLEVLKKALMQEYFV